MPSVSRPRRPDPGGSSVYPPREDTFLLLPFARVRPGSTFLDVGTGNGRLALEAARGGARVVATDRNPAALRQLRRTARTEHLDLTAVRTDLAAGLGRFDRVLANPPYLPTVPEERDPDPWHNLALDGGPDGCAVTARLLADLAVHLAPGGQAYLLVSSLQSASRLRTLWSAWRRAGGTRRRVAVRTLEGETLSVYRLARRRGRLTPTARRTPSRPPGTRGRRRNRPVRRSG